MTRAPIRSCSATKRNSVATGLPTVSDQLRAGPGLRNGGQRAVGQRQSDAEGRQSDRVIAAKAPRP
jgi:hypothetical protein